MCGKRPEESVEDLLCMESGSSDPRPFWIRPCTQAVHAAQTFREKYMYTCMLYVPEGHLCPSCCQVLVSLLLGHGVLVTPEAFTPLERYSRGLHAAGTFRPCASDDSVQDKNIIIVHFIVL